MKYNGFDKKNNKKGGYKMEKYDIEKLNNIELMKIIYKEIMELKSSINNKTEEKVDRLTNSVNKLETKVEKIDELAEAVNKLETKVEKIDELADTVNKMEKDFKEMKKDIKEIKTTLDKHSEKLEEHDKKLESLDNKTDKIFKNLDDLSRTEKLHFEYTTNKFSRLDQKLDSNFKYLDEKMDNTKNKLVSEATDVFESFSIATTKSIKNIENKIDNEKHERIIEIGNIKGMDDYNKIILRNLESRISILEEESEKYTVI